VFIGSCNGVFRRLDAKSGTVRWETDVRDKAAAKYFFHGDAFVAPDRIIASADVDTSAGAQAGVHAFDRDSGRLLWKHSTGRGVAGAVIGSAKRVFAYTIGGELIALDVESGNRAWSYGLKADGYASPAVVGHRLFAGSADGSLYALSRDTGTVEWQRKLGAPITTSVRASGSNVYVGTADGVMHRVAAGDGEASSLKLDAALKPFSEPLVTQNAVLVLLADQGADYRALVSIDSSLGRVNWRRAAPDRWTTSRVFVSGNAVFLGTPSGDVTAYCLADGSPAWSYKLSDAPIRSIGGSDEILYAGTPAGTLYALRRGASCN
jgi:outer membrane protein assembly factor BamB